MSNETISSALFDGLPNVEPEVANQVQQNVEQTTIEPLSATSLPQEAKEPTATAIAEPMPLPVPRPRALLDAKPQASNMPAHNLRVAQGATTILGQGLMARN